MVTKNTQTTTKKRTTARTTKSVKAKAKVNVDEQPIKNKPEVNDKINVVQKVNEPEKVKTPQDPDVEYLETMLNTFSESFKQPDTEEVLALRAAEFTKIMRTALNTKNALVLNRLFEFFTVERHSMMAEHIVALKAESFRPSEYDRYFAFYVAFVELVDSIRLKRKFKLDINALSLLIKSEIVSNFIASKI